MALQRLRCEWTGTGVEGPGLTTFFAEADGTLAISVGATGFFTALRSRIPTGTSIFVPNGGDLIDELTGTLTGTWGTSGGTTISCNGAGSFAGGVGARVVWETDTIRAGRRVRGSTFVVPLVVSGYEANGTLAGVAVTDLEQAIADMLVQVPTQMRVWSRPRPGLTGAGVQVARGVAPDKVSWLRTRRT